MGTLPQSIDQLIQSYLLCCTAEAKSPRTIEWYDANLTRFSQFLRDRGLSLRISDIGTDQARSFILHLQNDVRRWESCPAIKDTRGLSPLSIQGYARAIKAFWSWLLREGYIGYNPMARLGLPRVPKKVIAGFSTEQIHRLLGAADLAKAAGFRNYAIILVLFDTGIRLSELANLTLEDIDLEGCCFRVKGKGSKERIVPYGSQVRRALWRYITRFRPDPAYPQATNLFLSRCGVPLRPRSFESIITRLGNKAGISGIRCSPHSFRHTFARQFLLNGGNVFSLQAILGHSSLQAAMVYVNLASEDIKAQHRRCSPADNMILPSRRKSPGERRSSGSRNIAAGEVQHLP